MKKFLLIIVFFSLSIGLYAQFDFVEHTQQQVMRNEWNITFVPHYILFNGIRFDIEHVNGLKAWGLSPQFYYLKRTAHPVSYSDASLNSLIGGGLGIFRKFIKSSTQKNLGYWALGFGVNYFSLGYEQFTWVPKTFYDQTVYDYELVKHSGTLLRFDINATIGLERKLWDFLIFEPYAGVGYRYTIPFLPGDNNPFDNVLGFGYSGPLFIVGIKLGSGKSLSQPQF